MDAKEIESNLVDNFTDVMHIPHRCSEHSWIFDKGELEILLMPNEYMNNTPMDGLIEMINKNNQKLGKDWYVLDCNWFPCTKKSGTDKANKAFLDHLTVLMEKHENEYKQHTYHPQ